MNGRSGETAHRARVRIFRFDPAQDREGRYDILEVPLDKGTVVLDTLRYIYENLDGTLAFEHGCRYGRCGLCAVKMNGEPRLACQTMAEPEMLIEPLENFPVVRDLVVDRSETSEALQRIHPVLHRAPGSVRVPETLPPSRFEIFKEVSRCIGCLTCHSSCPSLSLNRYQFSGPSVLVELSRYAFDPRDRMPRVSLAQSAGLFNCFECGKCEEVCPQRISIEARALASLRSLALKNNAVPPELAEILETLKELGRPFRPSPSHSIGRGKSSSDAAPGLSRVGLFVGCTFGGDPRLQGTAEKFQLILHKLGWQGERVADEVCCGMPWMQMGEIGQADAMVEKNVLALENTGIEGVIALCPGCGLVMKKEWPASFARRRGRNPKFRVWDITEFLSPLISHISKGMERIPLKVAFHDPCHLKRGQGISEAPRDILRSLPGLEIREAAGPRCCGGGGMVRSTNRKLAQAASVSRIEEFASLQVDGVVTTCPTCLLQLSLGIRSSRTAGVRAFHLLDLLEPMV